MGSKKAVLIAGLFFTVLLNLPALDWPDPQGIILNNFGQNEDGKPALGMSFSSEGEIYASGSGEILFHSGSYASVSSASRLPSPLGVWTAIDHGDGIISVYSRMDEKNQIPVNPVNITTRNVLGYSGLSGWSNSSGFYFFLYDRKERRWINPLMIVNPRPDERPPVIHWVRLRNEEGRVFDPAVTRTLSQGLYTISVSASDTMMAANENPLAPFRIVCSLNGVESGSLNFETYSARDGSLMVYRNGLVPTKEIFTQFPGWEVGTIRFTRGQATLEVIVQDYAGLARNTVFRLQIE
ncbi:MAG: M23 family metallopeptidase [Kiritimatiellaeota bacterium]|nr:M23 family metallopeptidase [Kiritimatiellota bacterium]